jgi:hypothetical protein
MSSSQIREKNNKNNTTDSISETYIIRKLKTVSVQNAEQVFGFGKNG